MEKNDGSSIKRVNVIKVLLKEETPVKMNGLHPVLINVEPKFSMGLTELYEIAKPSINNQPREKGKMLYIFGTGPNTCNQIPFALRRYKDCVLITPPTSSTSREGEVSSWW